MLKILEVNDEKLSEKEKTGVCKLFNKYLSSSEEKIDKYIFIDPSKIRGQIDHNNKVINGLENEIEYLKEIYNNIEKVKYFSKVVPVMSEDNTIFQDQMEYILYVFDELFISNDISIKEAKNQKLTVLYKDLDKVKRQNEQLESFEQMKDWYLKIKKISKRKFNDR